MLTRSLEVGFVLLLAGVGLTRLSAQEAPSGMPRGVEVLARGPVHEAFASLTAPPVAPKPIPRNPPRPLDELPPAEKPDGNVIWISGYWSWDEDRNDFIWVSGVWRTPPPKKQWVAGYWREDTAGGWLWVPGFWTATVEKPDAVQEVTYLPLPPAAPPVSPGAQPVPDSFYVPGNQVWTGFSYSWRAGYWARVQPGYVWVPDHYRWTPSGYVHIAGYWDLAVSKRGILYAPVYVPASVIVVGYEYTPTYAVRDTIVVDSLFVRPTTCHYYFGDYYEARYRNMGYESCVVYSQRNYDSIIVYERYERRREPDWVNIQINLYNDRSAGRAPCPPRTLVEQNTFIQKNTYVTNVTNITMIAPPNQVASAKMSKMVTVDPVTRQQARQQAIAVQQVAAQRHTAEVPLKPGERPVARVAKLNVPRTEVVRPGMTAPRPTLPVSGAPSASIDKPHSGTTTPRSATLTSPVTSTTPAQGTTTPGTLPHGTTTSGTPAAGHPTTLGASSTPVTGHPAGVGAPITPPPGHPTTTGNPGVAIHTGLPSLPAPTTPARGGATPGSSGLHSGGVAGPPGSVGTPGVHTPASAVTHPGLVTPGTGISGTPGPGTPISPGVRAGISGPGTTPSVGSPALPGTVRPGVAPITHPTGLDNPNRVGSPMLPGAARPGVAPGTSPTGVHPGTAPMGGSAPPAGSSSVIPPGGRTTQPGLTPGTPPAPGTPAKTIIPVKKDPPPKEKPTRKPPPKEGERDK